MNYSLDNDEVILLESEVGYNRNIVNDYVTLTNKKMILESQKGIFKKRKELIEIINLDDIKIYNNEVQCKAKGFDVNIQTVNKNIKLTFNGLINPQKLATKITDVLTNTSLSTRGSNKVKKAIDTIDNATGLESREILKGVLENGIKGTLLHGFKKNKK